MVPTTGAISVQAWPPGRGKKILGRIRSRKWSGKWNGGTGIVSSMGWILETKDELHPRSLTVRPWKVTVLPKTKRVFQALFFRGELLNFGRVRLMDVKKNIHPQILHHDLVVDSLGGCFSSDNNCGKGIPKTLQKQQPCKVQRLPFSVHLFIFCRILRVFCIPKFLPPKTPKTPCVLHPTPAMRRSSRWLPRPICRPSPFWRCTPAAYGDRWSWRSVAASQGK